MSNDRVPTQTETGTDQPELDENHVIAERRAKLARIRETGIAFPNDFAREDEAAVQRAG